MAMTGSATGADTQEPDSPERTRPAGLGRAPISDRFAGGAPGRRRIFRYAFAIGLVVIAAAAFLLGGVHSDGGSAPAVLPVAPGIAPGAAASSSGAGANGGADMNGGAGVNGSAGVDTEAGSDVVGAPAPGRASLPGSQPDGTGDQARPAGAEVRIVRTGSVALWVRPGGVDAAVTAIETAAKGLGGYLSALDSSGSASATDSGGERANVTLRVPSGSFEPLRDQVGKIGEVRASTVSTRDVTGQYVDLQSRLKALRSSQDSYLALLAKAGTIGEVLAVRQQIDNVQLRIEQLEGQRQVLADSSDLATLTVGISERGAAAGGAPDGTGRGLGRAVRLSWDRFVGGLTQIVALIGPIILILLSAATVYMGYRLARRASRRTSRPASPAPPADSAPPAPSAPSADSAS
ncbi:DUF4349 domain-containing protein [Frankia sp. Cj3]|uniref:DUF4349 domain-containing protein n=1 Tax=Frankia sp. Cj3 TaxID=2880976 RepID=UPI001EF7157A|nr:DUF4349 domain-containing protein [Frankia sp. Cj3]